MEKTMIPHICLGILLLGIVITPSVFAGDGCGTGTVLVDGVCQLAPVESSEGCGAGTVMVNGVCQLAKTGSPFNILSGSTIEPLYIVIGAAAIGAAIIGIVFVVRRGSGGTLAPKPARQDLDDYESKYLARQGQRPTRKPAEARQTSSSCSNCGARLKPAAKFCGKCGSKQ
ncbi:zinc ribbon domain-containing protein [Marine Group I thaumarchaeote]|uniref:Zinc ribbon domain-containing protein n=1 Tax=Marine Group I thaumarchaeote TaxID=2511932 RepID=A0A7K4NP72_9ARCH|nr:zinc ribbon domain-containing protein [Marine Group I thaumarchaeote]